MDVETFQLQLKKRPITLAYFSYPACQVCKVLRPKVEALAGQYDLVDFIYVDTHQAPKLAGQYTVFTVPTLIIFVDGRESKRLSRHFAIADVQTFLDRIITVMEN
ncbi:MAG: thioredoxin [Calditrichaeota bacterium]|nr:MAG: thioredoxin [Calditrichota bacterium]